MQLKSTLLFMASLATFSTAFPHSKRGGDWTSTPSDGKASTKGFGKQNSANTGTVDLYQGNTGDPWGSNMIEISSSDAPNYQYVVQIKGQNSEPWKVVFWNKYGPSGGQNGHYGESAISFTLGSGETKYVAFDTNTQGGMGAYPAGEEAPMSDMGAYAFTYGEFDFGNQENNAWVGFDVSTIQANIAGEKFQGMQMCDAIGDVCSSVTSSGTYNNAYSKAEEDIGGIGANLPAGPARIAIVIDYEG